MDEQVGSAERPLRVAIVGAGPSGFYAAGALFKQKDLHASVDMFDRLATPHGLVRYGVAPDHQNIKSVTKVYDRTATSPLFRFFGNVNFGVDIMIDDLHRHYDQIIFAVGAQSDRKLNIPGEDLPNSISATEFVAWYNGHPYFADLDPDLSSEGAVVVGVGNVAMDVTRILAKSVDELRYTDIADHALDMLAESRIKNIYVLARRGPAQAKFTNPEIKEFAELEIADVLVDADDLLLDPASAAQISDDSGAKRNMETLRQLAQVGITGKPRCVHFLFKVSPVEIIGENGRITRVCVEKNELSEDTGGYIGAHGTGERWEVPAGLVMRSIGYRGVRLPGVSFDDRRGIIPNNDGRVVDLATGDAVAGEYVVGWAKRGPTGVIGTNKPDAVQTVSNMADDVAQLTPAAEPECQTINDLLDSRNVRYISIDDWHVLNEMEVEAGLAQGRPRVKFVQLDEMLKILAERD